MFKFGKIHLPKSIIVVQIMLKFILVQKQIHTHKS